MGWVGLSWIFFDSPWWIGSKNPLNLTQPDPCTPLNNSHVLIFVFNMLWHFLIYVDLLFWRWVYAVNFIIKLVFGCTKILEENNKLFLKNKNCAFFLEATWQSMWHQVSIKNFQKPLCLVRFFPPLFNIGMILDKIKRSANQLFYATNN